MANTLNALASSDVGKFAQTILFAAFPELFVVKTIATPVLRQFIEVVSTFHVLVSVSFFLCSNMLHFAEGCVINTLHHGSPNYGLLAGCGPRYLLIRLAENFSPTEETREIWSYPT